MIDISLRLAGNNRDNIIVLSIPDWGFTPFAEGRDREKISYEIDQFNMVVKEESELAGFTYFDITGISRQAADDRTLIADDGLHPSELMYSLWIDKIYAIVREMVE